MNQTDTTDRVQFSSAGVIPRRIRERLAAQNLENGPSIEQELIDRLRAEEAKD